MHNSSQHSLVACRLLAFDLFFFVCSFLFGIIFIFASFRNLHFTDDDDDEDETTTRTRTRRRHPATMAATKAKTKAKEAARDTFSFSSRAFGGSRAVVEVVE